MRIIKNNICKVDLDNSKALSKLLKNRFYIFLFLILFFIVGCSQKIENNIIIPRENIHFYNDRLVINFPDSCVGADFSGISMSPAIKEENIEVLCPPNNIKIGDIACFNITKYCLKNKCNEKKLRELTGFVYNCHRIIKRGIDEEGEYYITKGDNIIFTREKLREEDIEYVIGMVIY